MKKVSNPLIAQLRRQSMKIVPEVGEEKTEAEKQWVPGWKSWAALIALGYFILKPGKGVA